MLPATLLARMIELNPTWSSLTAMTQNYQSKLVDRTRSLITLSARSNTLILLASSSAFLRQTRFAGVKSVMVGSSVIRSKESFWRYFGTLLRIITVHRPQSRTTPHYRRSVGVLLFHWIWNAERSFRQIAGGTSQPAPISCVLRALINEITDAGIIK